MNLSKLLFAVLSMLLITTSSGSVNAQSQKTPSVNPTQKIILKDTDGDGIPDLRDCDDDGNNLLDEIDEFLDSITGEQKDTLVEHLRELFSTNQTQLYPEAQEQNIQNTLNEIEELFDGIENLTVDDIDTSQDGSTPDPLTGFGRQNQEQIPSENKFPDRYQIDRSSENDFDGDGRPNDTDPDDDNDGVLDTVDPDANGDGLVDQFQSLNEKIFRQINHLNSSRNNTIWQ